MNKSGRSKIEPLKRKGHAVEVDLHSGSVAEVEHLIRDWEAAICRGDMDAILRFNSADVRMFDVPVPLEVGGLPDYRATWELFFRHVPNPEGRFVIETLQITAGSEVAFASGLLRIGGSTEPVCRLTIGLERRDGTWMIIHEHHSMPHVLPADDTQA
ncbi:MAG: nuclear transport factor 2 family protein [Tabrizicola sp.]|nr:nuclear transport factor 2 family protein [Tabrizicola sp.]